jgi:phosphodiesterase/alkaline phosphatase D-like protein
MNKVVLSLALAVMAGSLFVAIPTGERRRAGTPEERVRITDGPEVESVTDCSAIIRWTTNAGMSTHVQYGVVRYGTDPESLERTAKSPNRWNKSLPNMVYRVRIDDLQPGTTYHYAVDSTRADGFAARLETPTRKFTTLARSG